METANPKGYIQVGYTALRCTSTGGFAPAVPLFIREDDRAAVEEHDLIDNVGALFAMRMKAYRNGREGAEGSPE